MMRTLNDAAASNRRAGWEETILAQLFERIGGFSESDAEADQCRAVDMRHLARSRLRAVPDYPGLSNIRGIFLYSGI